ncbi:LysR family transcriptional regulator [Alcaligenes aquatilis]|uniref:LysR family transcriptional regulator n=1 Tax=Alcaligenes aquatilis TaxID=323284 RepID=A0A3G2HXK7_9BURK|nr:MULTISPECIES: LysR family transcriptional regulator [Alcaligenes]AWG36678.1 LysR family transcriptional regulator [Alcaligenes aquatilis]AYN21892.1 LysR family transcriptional regulator [Alcaligenes aquatilis]QXR35292.1 LysR family transcriptional regulator [Alcaligenes aquatilis]HBQ90874.1 LysR family transcriptional regulator [Alcaligenes faecalis]
MSWSERIRLKHLQVLIRLCEQKSMSDVARQSNMTQPALSKWLKDFEDSIGMPLFERHARGIEPLPAALALVSQAQGVLNRLDRMNATLEQYRQGFRQQFTLGISPMVAAVYLPQLLVYLHERDPQCHIRIQEGTLDVLSRNLEQGELDLVIGRVDEAGRNPAMAYLPLGMVPLGVAACRKHPLARQNEVTWEQTLEYPWILPPKNSPMRRSFELSLDAKGLPYPTCAIESAYAHTNARVAVGSDFLVPMTRSMVPVYPELCILELDWSDPRLHGQLGLLWRPQDSGEPMLEEVISWMSKQPHTV